MSKQRYEWISTEEPNWIYSWINNDGTILLHTRNPITPREMRVFVTNPHN
jgi:hypothetical protein